MLFCLGVSFYIFIALKLGPESKIKIFVLQFNRADQLRFLRSIIEMTAAFSLQKSVCAEPFRLWGWAGKQKDKFFIKESLTMEEFAITNIPHSLKKTEVISDEKLISIDMVSITLRQTFTVVENIFWKMRCLI